MPTLRSREETARRGGEIYERDIRQHVEPDRVGRIVAIDVDSGDYAVGDGILAAVERLRSRRPDAAIWSVRVGYRAMWHFGGGSLRRAE